MVLKIFTDGGSLNNPGQAACSFVVYKDGLPFHKFSKKLGLATNNFAEYSGVISAFEWLKQNSSVLEGASGIEFYSDSLLLVNQLNGLYKIKNSALRDFVFKVRGLEQTIKLPVRYIDIPREKNHVADSLVKKALGR